MRLLDQAMDPKTLHHAFLRARSWSWDAPMYDTVEIQLFEWRRRESLRDAARALRENWAPKPILAYRLPKDAHSARVYSWRPFFDEVVSTAASLALGSRLERRMDHGGRMSFGNRLSQRPHDDELFVPWDRAWEDFSRAANAAARHAPHGYRSDIQNFYPEIPHARLASAFRRRILDKDLRAWFLRWFLRAAPGGVPFGGIPVGPAASGFVANLYLMDLDDAMRSVAPGAFVRYVDDVFVFGRSRAERERRAAQFRGVVRGQLGLRPHGEAKSERGVDREPLPLGGSDPAWDGPAALFDRVFGSLYRLPGSHGALYERSPDRYLRVYSRALRRLGFFVSTDLLAQRMQIQRAGAPRARVQRRGTWRLHLPPLDLDHAEREGSAAWARSFRDANPDFLRAASALRRVIRARFEESWRDLGDLARTPKAQLKGNLYALRYWGARMARLAGDDGTHRAFEILLDYPWAIEPRDVVNGLFSHPARREILLRALDSRRNELVRARAAWGLGEMGERSAVPALWEAAKRNRHPLLRRAALEALLRIDWWKPIEPGWVATDHDREADPGVRKFYSLILARMAARRRVDAGFVRAFLRARLPNERDWTARRALEFALSDAGGVFSLRGARGGRRGAHEVAGAHHAEAR